MREEGNSSGSIAGSITGSSRERSEDGRRVDIFGVTGSVSSVAEEEDA